jgi:hypothetical protein
MPAGAAEAMKNSLSAKMKPGKRSAAPSQVPH